MTDEKSRKTPGPAPVHQALLQIRLSPTLKEAAARKARAQGESLSDILRRLIMEWLDR